MADQNASTQPGVLQVPTTVRALMEALIFGAREPLSERQIQTLYEAQGVEGGELRNIDYETIRQLVEELNAEYSAADRPYRIVQIAGGYQFATQPAYAEWLGKLYKEQARRKLSQSSIETLAIIAYKQPITKPEIESIRGVNCDYVLSTLLEKDLATIVGRAPTVGRPLLYGTTNEFLRHFGLNTLNDLPRPREIQEILGDHQFETERRMLEAQQGLFEEKKEEEFKSRLPHIPKRKAEMDEEVHIVPKKRIRKIKVRPSEGTPENRPEEAEGIRQPAQPEGSERPSLEEPPISAPVEPVESEAVPTIENDSEIPGSPAEPEIQSSDASILTDSLKYVDLTRKPSGEPETMEEIEAVTSESVEDKVEMPEVSAEEPIQRDEVELKGEVTEIVEDLSGELVAESQEVQEPSVPESSPEPVSAEVENKVQTPGAVESAPLEESAALEVYPPVVEQTSDGPIPEPGQPTEQTQIHHHDLTSKSRWTTWKEKIQGFIKKLFG